METIKPQENQTIFDMALQEYGSIEGLFDLLNDNNIDRVDSSLSVYEDLQIITAPTRGEIKEFYMARNILPATEATAAELALLIDEDKDCVGVGCMEIGEDFEVCPPDADADKELITINGIIFYDGFASAFGKVYYKEVDTDEFIEINVGQLIRQEPNIYDEHEFSIQIFSNTNYQAFHERKTFGDDTPIKFLSATTTSSDLNQEQSVVFNSSEISQKIAQGNEFRILLPIA